MVVFCQQLIQIGESFRKLVPKICLAKVSTVVVIVETRFSVVKGWVPNVVGCTPTAFLAVLYHHCSTSFLQKCVVLV